MNNTHIHECYQRDSYYSLYKKPKNGKGRDALASAGMSSRKAGTLPKKLGTNNKGPVGPRYSKGVPYRIPHNTPPDSEAAPSTNESVLGGHNADRIAKTNSKTSSDRSHYASRGCIPLHSLPSTQKGRGPTSVINLKPLNCFVQTHHFKMEGMHDLKNLLREGDWLVKVDLKDAFFSVPIHLEHRQYLSFTVGNTSYQFTSVWCQPLGSLPRPLDQSQLSGESCRDEDDRCMTHQLECVKHTRNTGVQVTLQMVC